MKKFLTIALIVMIAALGFACISNAYSINMESNTKKEVTPEETFTLTIAMDEKTSLANGHINYDTKLFEFVSANQENMSAQAYIEEGYVSWMYTNTNSGIDSYTFSFKAKDVSKTSTGTFTLTDAVFIAESEETYEGETLKGTSKVDVTIKVEEKATADDKDDKVDSEDKKENATTTTDKESGKKDNTITSDTKLPQTGKGMLAYIVIALATLAIVLKVKHKKMSKLFSVLVIPVVATMLMATSVSALKLADTDNYQVGLFDSLIDGEKIVAVNPGKTFYTNTDLSLEMLQSIFSEENLTIDTIKDSKGNVLEDTSKIATGNKVVLTDESEYTVLLYGDANGDGTICNCIDVNVIREEYVYGDKASEVNRIAADLSPDNILNVKDVALIIKKYTNKVDGHLVTPFPDDDYELPKQTIKDEDVLKINSVDTTSNTATINIELNTTGLTANSITYEIYDAGNVLVKTHTVTDLTTLAHIFEELEPEKEYFVIVTVDCDEANYYAEQTVTTKASTDEPDEPINPDEPTDRVIEAELVISNVKAGSADMEIVLADGTTLEDDDKVFFGHSAGSHGGQVQHDELSYQKMDLDANKEQTFWATIYDKDNNTLWFSEYQSVKTPAIEFDLTANKDADDPKTKISATLSNINSDKFDFEKIQCKVEKITFNDKGDPSAWTVVLDEEIKSLDTNITFSQLTPGESYNVEVRIYDTAGNFTKKIVENIKMDSDGATEPDEPVEPDEPRELTAELEVIDLGEDSIKVKINLSDELLDGETISYAITPAANGVETSGFITDTEYTFSGLSKNIPYSIMATVYDEDRAEICKTETITANIVEDNVAIAEVETTTNSIKVRLSGAPNRVITENDKIVFKITDINNNVKATSLEYSIEEANGLGHTFTDLNPNTQYYVYAILQNENGITATSNILDITTNEEEGPDEPVTPDEPTTGYSATLEVDEITVTTSSLLVALEITPELENYSVKYYANGTTSYESTKDTHTFENLKAGETYAFWAEVYNEDGEKVATTDMVTQLMPSPDIFVNVDASDTNPESSILVSASPNASDKFSIEKYDMWISKVNTEDSTYTIVKAITDVEATNGTIENYEITGLEANTNYLVTVKGTDNGGNEVTKTATITTAEAPRELAGYLEVTKNYEGTVSVKINITNGALNSETDIICFRNSAMGPKEWNQATGLTYTYSELPTNDKEITFLAQIMDSETGLTYSMEEVIAKPMSLEPVTIKATTTNTITIVGKLPNNIANEKIVYKIADNNGYENEYETNLAELNTLNFEYKFIGLDDNTAYNVWFEIYDENDNLLADSDKVQAKTARELEIDLELGSTIVNPSYQANVTLSATVGEFLSSDYVKLYRGGTYIGEMPLDLYGGSTEVSGIVFGNLSANETVKLSVAVYDESDTKLAEDAIDVLIRDVEITQFEISNLEIRNVVAARALSQATGIMETDKVIYEVRKEGESSSTTKEGSIGVYTYEDLVAGETYYFTLKVYDEEWNLLAESEEIEHTVPLPKIDLTLNNTETNPSTQIDIAVTVNAAEDTYGFVPTKYDYYIYKVNSDGSTTEVKRNLGATSSNWTATDLLPSTEYKVVVTAKDTTNNTSATTEGTITTADTVDTIIVITENDAIDGYIPTNPGPSTTDREIKFEKYTDADVEGINIEEATLKITVTNAEMLAAAMQSPINTLLGNGEEVDITISEDNKIIEIPVKNTQLSNISSLPIIFRPDKNLNDGDKITIDIEFIDLTTSPRQDITIEGQATEVVVNYRVDETPEIALNVQYEADSDEATATIDVTNLAKVDKYYYKLYNYDDNNELHPVEGSDGSWVELDNNEYVFDNLAENTTYLVVVKAESIQGNYSEEKKYEFTTTAFKPVIELTANPTEEQPATQITVEAAVTNGIAIKNYQFALIDNVHTTEDGKAIYIEMPVEANSTNSYNFTGLYPNTQYTAFGQVESEKGVMSNYNNKSVSTKVIRDPLTVADQATTDSITVTADDTNIKAALMEINSQIGIYNINLGECTLEYHCRIQGSEDESLYERKNGVDIYGSYTSDFENYTFEGLVSGNTYEVWMEIYDKDGKQIWTTKQLVTDPETGEETGEESGDIVELEALQIASIEANRRQEYSLDVRVKLDEESLERLANNANANYTYNVEVYTVASIENSSNSQGPTPVIANTQLTAGGEYANIIGEYSINFADGKYYTEYDEETEEYLGDILHLEGLEPDTYYRVVVTVSDANGGTAEITDINRKDIKTRAAVPILMPKVSYKQTTYADDSIDAEQLYRVYTATINVTNDAVIDWETNNVSGFDFKLYENTIATEEHLVNRDQHFIRYVSNKDTVNEASDYEVPLEEQLLREEKADNREQTYTRRFNDLTENKQYLITMQAISRVGEGSSILTSVFTAYWRTPEIVSEVIQNTATETIVNIENTNDYKVKKYTVNLIEATDVQVDDNGTVIEWKRGNTVYTEDFNSSDGDFIDSEVQSIQVDLSECLELNKQYVLVVDVEAENGTSTPPYWILIETNPVARVSLDGNSSTYYTTLQSAIDAAEANETITLMKSTTEKVEFTNAEATPLMLTSENNAELNPDQTFNAIVMRTQQELSLENITINGTVMNLQGGELNVNDNVTIDNKEGPYGIYTTDAVTNILGTDVVIQGTEYGVYNTSGNVTVNGDKVKITGIYNEETLNITNNTNNSTIIGGTNDGIVNFGTAEITGKNITINSAPVGQTIEPTALYNYGEITINGSNINLYGDYRGIVNTGTDSTITILGTDNGVNIKADKNNGIINEGTSIDISGTVRISANGDGISNNSSANLNIDTGNISVVAGNGIAISNKGILNIKNSSSNAEKVIVTGNTSGISNSGTANISNNNISIEGKTYYGIQNVGTLSVNGKNIDITGNTSGIYNATQGTASIVGAGNNDDEAIEIKANQISDGIYNSNGIIEIGGKYVNVTGAAMGQYAKNPTGISNNDGDVIVNGSNINITGGQYGITTSGDSGDKVTIKGTNNGIIIKGNTAHAITNSGTIVDVEGKVNIEGNAYGIFNQSQGILNIKTGNVTVTGNSANGIHNTATLNIQNNPSNAEKVIVTGNTSGIYNNGTATIKDNNISIIGTEYYGIQNSGELSISGQNIDILGNVSGIHNSAQGDVTISGTNNGITIEGTSQYGIQLYNGQIEIDGNVNITGSQMGIYNDNALIINTGNINVTGKMHCGIYNSESASLDIINNSENSEKIQIQGGNAGITNAGTSVIKYSDIKIIGNTYGFSNSGELILDGKRNSETNLPIEFTQTAETPQGAAFTNSGSIQFAFSGSYNPCLLLTFNSNASMYINNATDGGDITGHMVSGAIRSQGSN